MKTNVDISTRWEDGIPHHPKSVELYEMIAAIDFKLQEDSLGLTCGGDGDNGENLMYALDIINDAIDNDELSEVKELLGLLKRTKKEKSRKK